MPLTKVVTTSWDDGDSNDLRIAALLRDRGIAGTFYVPITGPKGRPVLGSANLRALLSQGFEVGAHGTSHIALREIPDDELAREVGVCKAKLEDILGETIRTFCYPKGQYDARVIREVKNAGYEGARTTEMLGYELDTDPFRMSTTVHAFPHTGADYLKNAGRALRFRRALDWALHYRNAANWVELAKATFDRVLRDGGVWHLYGHSWAIEKYNLWPGLSEVLDYVARRQGVRYLSNCEALGLSRQRQHFLPGDCRTTEQ